MKRLSFMSGLFLQKSAFGDIALLLAGFFENLDLVLSDFIAGMILLRTHQKELFSQTIKQVGM